MKILLSTLLLCLFTSILHAETLKHKTSALETNGIKVEFFSSSNYGVITPIGCSYCLQKTYKFYSDININKKGKTTTLQSLLAEYSRAKYPTIFINLDSNVVYKLNY
ncbi:hypothetical protein NBRC116188_26720 [Oceaniserpentilla sp. 4NH20-0058]|uniref:hypothetical protein n=1 Tax=Oceaniserpentilla sp. 4NH20-0058 TaxID=3127660 RepID=UPI00310C5A5B